MRKVFAFFDAQSLLKREKEIKDKLAEEKLINRRKRDEAAWEAQAAQTFKRIEKKKAMRVDKHIRNTRRSERPILRVKTNETVKTPPEVEEMRRYLGQMPEDWEAEMFKE